MKGRRRSGSGLTPEVYINITPLVDVTFFILIIFILIAPLMEHGINVNLPAAQAKKLEKPDSITVSLRKADGGTRLYLENERLTLDQLTERLTTIASRKSDTALILRADKDLKYESVVEVIDRITDAGISKMGLATMAKGGG